MTENEVFEGIHKDCGSLEICNYKKTGCGDCPIRQTLIRAEKALDEIQQYRAIGTVEEFKALKEKSVAKEMDRYYCPICRHYFEDTDAYNYCPVCGQKMKSIWK